MTLGNSPALQRTIIELETKMPEISKWLLTHPDLELREFFALVEFNDTKTPNADAHYLATGKIVLPSMELLHLLSKLEEDLDVQHGLYEHTGDEAYALETERLLDDIDFAAAQFGELLARLETSGAEMPASGPKDMTLGAIETARNRAYDGYRLALIHELPNSPQLKKLHREYAYWDHVLKAARRRGIAVMGAEAAPRPFSGR